MDRRSTSSGKILPRRGEVAPQATEGDDGDDLERTSPPAPSTTLRAVPLPLAGEDLLHVEPRQVTHPLNMTKLAFGCDEVATLRDRLLGRAERGETFITTRYRPTRHPELVGGSLYWIVKHQLVARSPILGFVEDEGRWRIRLEPALVPVRVRPKRAHQGWRYLPAADAPMDLDGAVDELAALPPALVSALTALALV